MHRLTAEVRGVPLSCACSPAALGRVDNVLRLSKRLWFHCSVLALTGQVSDAQKLLLIENSFAALQPARWPTLLTKAPHEKGV